jgi:hypothetical protein
VGPAKLEAAYDCDASIVTSALEAAGHVIPAKAGIQYFQMVIDSRLRGNGSIDPNSSSLVAFFV